MGSFFEKNIYKLYYIYDIICENKSIYLYIVIDKSPFLWYNIYNKINNKSQDYDIIILIIIKKVEVEKNENKYDNASFGFNFNFAVGYVLWSCKCRK